MWKSTKILDTWVKPSWTFQPSPRVNHMQPSEWPHSRLHWAEESPIWALSKFLHHRITRNDISLLFLSLSILGWFVVLQQVTETTLLFSTRRMLHPHPVIKHLPHSFLLLHLPPVSAFLISPLQSSIPALSTLWDGDLCTGLSLLQDWAVWEPWLTVMFISVPNS